ncbi:hypothetical protein [Anaeromyxobacter oryzisoli]|uniref:hypothetical protein n=1 Tax=Anaeromyxobacter oryzisoli TaxID=2925408 RepID=UPI001F573168|nr:hypothetical protein [Anaeromyxobacter sp. SG63]
MAFVDPSAVRQMDGWNQAWANDGKCRAVFYAREVLDERATHGWTEEREVLNDDGSIRIEKKRFPGAGRPIFKTVPYIKKFTPGDASNIIDREVYPHDKDEFSAEWHAFETGQDTTVGTPIEMLPGLSKARVEEFKNFPLAPIKTIEELANLADVHAQKFLGFNEDRQKARDWLAAAEKAAPIAEVRAQLAERDQAIEQLKARLAALEAQRAAVPATPASEPECEPVEVTPAPRAKAPTVRRRAQG